MSKRKYLTKAECAEKGWFNKVDLKLERLKPAPGQLPIESYWQGQGFVDVYDKAQCVAMRPYRKPTPKQMAALERGRDLLGTHECESEGCKNRVYTWEDERICHQCVNESHKRSKQAMKEGVVLDTETTGLDGVAQVIEIAIVDWNGKTLINQRIRPTVAISVDAQRVHGISMDDLAGVLGILPPNIAKTAGGPAIRGLQGAISF